MTGVRRCPATIPGYGDGVRVVVTGASGNVGTALLRALAERDWAGAVVGVSRRRPADVAPYTGVRWEECDVGTPGAADRLVPVFAGADAVVHLAWAVQPGPDDPPMSGTNLMGSRAVLRAVTAARVRRLVCASSVAAYRPPPRWARVTESGGLGGVPGCAYSRQKAALEAMLDGFQAGRPDVAVARIRPSSVVSADAGAELASWLISPLLPTRQAGRTLLPVPVWSGMRLQLVHAADVADAICRILEIRAVGAFNLAAEPVLRRAEFAASGVTSRRLPYPVLRGAAGVLWRAGLQPLHPGWLRMADRAALVSTRRARDVLGWAPRTSSITALAETIDAIRQAQPGRSPALAPWDRRPRPVGPAGVRFGRPLRQSQS
jgi:UDP-glucose 4-epimerase